MINQRDDIRVYLAENLKECIKKASINQTEASRIACMSKSRISDVINGHLDKFSLDSLVIALNNFGYCVNVKASKKRKYEE